MLSAMAPHGREMSQDLRKKIIYLHKKGEGYKKISKALLISQKKCSKSGTNILKRWNYNHLTETSRSPAEVNTSSGRLLMRRVEENRHASSLQLSKSRMPNWGDYFPWHNTAYTAEEWHAWVPSTKEASPKAQAQKSPPRFCQGPCWQRWRLGLYTLEWWDQDECFWNWWLQNCMASQRWGIQIKKESSYSETWWWQCPYVGLHECCWCRGAAFHWWHHEFTNVLLYTEKKMLPSLRALGRRALFQHDNDPKHTSKATAGFLKKNRVKVIQWPSMSPDLNPIEHLWGILKRQVEHHSPSCTQSLKEVILEEWKKIDLAKCLQLVHSMPRRLGAVIKNHGGHTKY